MVEMDWLGKNFLCNSHKHRSRSSFINKNISLGITNKQFLPVIFSSENVGAKKSAVVLSRFPSDSNKLAWKYWETRLENIQSIKSYSLIHRIIYDADDFSWEMMHAYLKGNDGCTFIFNSPLKYIEKIKEVNWLGNIYKFCGETQIRYNIGGTSRQPLVYSITLYPIDTVCPIYNEEKVDGVAIAFEVVENLEGLQTSITINNIETAHYVLFSNFEDNVFYLDGINLVQARSTLDVSNIYPNFEYCYKYQIEHPRAPEENLGMLLEEKSKKFSAKLRGKGKSALQGAKEYIWGYNTQDDFKVVYNVVGANMTQTAPYVKPYEGSSNKKSPTLRKIAKDITEDIKELEADLSEKMRGRSDGGFISCSKPSKALNIGSFTQNAQSSVCSKELKDYLVYKDDYKAFWDETVTDNTINHSAGLSHSVELSEHPAIENPVLAPNSEKKDKKTDKAEMAAIKQKFFSI